MSTDSEIEQEIRDFAQGMHDPAGQDADTLIILSRLFKLNIDQVESILARTVDAE